MQQTSRPLLDYIKHNYVSHGSMVFKFGIAEVLYSYFQFNLNLLLEQYKRVFRNSEGKRYRHIHTSI